jgi:hypothetical protein
MAFPTSSLTNNQVHKEGNRAFVYDSAIGVWDQVRETDRTENKIVQGEIGAGATFPAGHVVNSWFTKSNRTTSLAITSASGWTSTGATGNVTVTAGNDLFFWYTVQAYGTSARHWASGIKFDGTLIGNSSYGDGIYHGSTTTFTGWDSESNQTKITIASSGTFSVDLMVIAPAGTITIAKDNNLNSGIGYDKVTWMALEIQR